MSNLPENIRLHHIYELDLGPLTISVNGNTKTLTKVLLNGRGSYLIMQDLIADHLGLTSNSEGSDSDLKLENPFTKFEAKKLTDKKNVHTASSALFGPNSSTKQFKEHRAKSYNDALEFCRKNSYNKNDFYIYHWNTLNKLKFIIVPTDFVVSNLDKKDPRLISRKIILESVIKNAN